MSEFASGVVLLIAAWISGYQLGHGDILAAVLVPVAAVLVVVVNALILAIRRRLRETR